MNTNMPILSTVLCEFMNVPHNSTMGPSKVAEYINNYIRKNNLKTEKQKIYPDDTLIKLLELSEDDNLTYLNMAKYLKKHLTHTVAREELTCVSLVCNPPENRIEMFAA